MGRRGGGDHDTEDIVEGAANLTGKALSWAHNLLQTKHWFFLPDPQQNTTVTRVRPERLRKKSNIRERPKYQAKNRWENSTIKGN